MALYQRRTKTITAAYTVTDADVGYIIICNATAAITVTMQSGTGRENFWLTLQNIAANDVTCEGTAISQNNFAEVSNNSGTWVVLAAGAGAGGGQTAVFTNIAVSAYGTILADTAADTLHFQGINYIECSTDTATKTVIIDLSHIGATGAFSSIVVSGQNTIYAQTSSDALEFVASSNITITTDTAAQTVTFASTGGGQSAVFTSIVVSGQATILADTAADTLEFVAGSNISISTNTTNKTVTFAAVATGSVSVAFKYVEVSGQGTITADTAADTIEFIASSNITLTTDTANKTLTIAATGGGQSASFTSILVSGQSTILATTAADSLEFVASSNITITTNTSNKTITIRAADAAIPVTASATYNELYVGYYVQLSGTVTITAGSTSLSGTGTDFTAQLSAGDYVYAGAFCGVVSAITSATALTFTASPENDYTGANIYLCEIGNDANDGSAADSGHALATITEALTRVEPDAANLIYPIAGTYTAEGTITINNLTLECGTVAIMGDMDTLEPENVRMDLQAIQVYSPKNVGLYFLNFLGLNDFGSCVAVYEQYGHLLCYSLYMEEDQPDNTGIYILRSNARVVHCHISHKSTGIQADNICQVFCGVNYGTDVDYALIAGNGAIIHRQYMDSITHNITQEIANPGGFIGPQPYNKTITQNYTVTDNNSMIFVNETATVTLCYPTTQRRITVKRINAVGTATITNNAGETIDGAASVTITAQYTALTFESDGTNWFIT